MAAIRAFSAARVSPSATTSAAIFADSAFRMAPASTANFSCDMTVMTVSAISMHIMVEKPFLKAHLAAPHMAAYREQVKDLVGGVALQVLEPA